MDSRMVPIGEKPLGSTISIIIPSYNQGRFIERTLRSILDQSVAALECIVFDGGSQDETKDILRRYGDRVLWISESDRGQSHAVNKGIAKSKGEIIGWINSDDIYYPETFAKVQKFFAQNQNIDVLYGDAFHIDEDDIQIGNYSTEPWNFERLKEICFLCQPAVFFRRRVVEQFGYLDESLQFCMDYEFWLRLGENGAVFAYMPATLAGSRWYAENKTFSNLTAVHAEIINMLIEKYKKIPVIWIYRYVGVSINEHHISRDTWMYKLSIFWCLILAFLRWRQGIPKEFVLELGTRIGVNIKNVIKQYIKL